MRKAQLLSACAILAFAGCNRQPSASDAQRAADEKRIAELKGLEQRAADREAVDRAAQLEADRQRLAQDQAALDQERQKLEDEKAAARDDAQRQTRIQAEERRIAQREAALKADRDRAEAAEREARAQRREQEQKIDFFYSALDPMGDWLQVEPYGYVWQPREAQSPGWRPYTNGNWVYTEYGWTWNTPEPFGWATYHYGRWTRVRGVGWIWAPGSEWAPAWVSWRQSPEYLGWAPLPPEAHSGGGFNAGVDSYYDIGPTSYVFVPVSRIGERSYRGLTAEPERNVTIINQTVNVTKINYTTVQQNTVVFNAGPDLAKVNAAAAQPVPRLNLQRESTRAATPGAGGSGVSGNVMKLLAPAIVSAPRAATAPATVKETVKAPQVEHGWGTSDVAAAQAARAKMKEEAAAAESQARSPAASSVKAARPGANPPPASLPPERISAPATPAPERREPPARAEQPPLERERPDRIKPDRNPPPASIPGSAPAKPALPPPPKEQPTAELPPKPARRAPAAPDVNGAADPAPAPKPSKPTTPATAEALPTPVPAAPRRPLAPRGDTAPVPPLDPAATPRVAPPRQHFSPAAGGEPAQPHIPRGEPPQPGAPRPDAPSPAKSLPGAAGAKANGKTADLERDPSATPRSHR